MRQQSKKDPLEPEGRVPTITTNHRPQADTQGKQRCEPNDRTPPSPASEGGRPAGEATLGDPEGAPRSAPAGRPTQRASPPRAVFLFFLEGMCLHPRRAGSAATGGEGAWGRGQGPKRQYNNTHGKQKCESILFGGIGKPEPPHIIFNKCIFLGRRAAESASRRRRETPTPT